MLPESSLEWLRHLHGGLDDGDWADAAELDEALRSLAEMATRTPAWAEVYVSAAARLAAHRSDVTPALVHPPCPQLVDVDFPTMAFTRAEWSGGNLRLRLAPLRHEPRVFTSFRVVGAEPRMWDVHGIDGVSLDVTSTALNVRVPLVAGDLELLRSSY